VEKAFKEIRAQSHWEFVYTEETIKEAHPVSLKIQKASLAVALNQVCSGQPFSFSLEDHFIIIKRLEKELSPKYDLTGVIIDPKGQPVIGATIMVKGKKQLALSDENGNFSIHDLNEQDILVISSIGFHTLEWKPEGKTHILIQLQIQINSLDETVLIAYGTTTKRLNTGSVSTIKGTELEKQPISNPLQALEGRMPGVYISQSTGVAGGELQIQIRGRNSLRGDGNYPLYIIDGVPYTNTAISSDNASGLIIPSPSPLNSLNPKDIERIDILKDADATAIYGSRGANGVILITTKKGQPGKTKLDLNASSGWGHISRQMHLLSTPQYLSMREEAFRNDQRIPGPGNGYDLLTWDTSRYTDWQKTLIGGTSRYLDGQMILSGGSVGTSFLLSAAYHKETSVFPGNFSDNKGNVHFSLNHNSGDQRLKINLSFSYGIDLNQLPRQDLTNQALTLAPDAPPIHNPDGSLNWANSTWTNPFSFLSQSYKGTTYNLVTNGHLSYELLNHFNFITNLGYTQLQVNEISTIPLRSFDPSYGITSGYGFYGTNSIRTWIAEPQLEYSRSAKQSTWGLLAGATFQQDDKESTTLIGNGFSSDAVLENIQAASSVTVNNNSITRYRYNGFFGRIHYVYRDKFLANLTGRRDGSSRFGPHRQFANFGAIGLGWIFSKESFFSKGLRFLSYGKLRSSYGITGSDQIPDYGFLDTYSVTSYPYQNSGLVPSRLVNPDFAWEVNRKWESALELGFWKDRLEIDLSYYRNRSSNQLVGYSLPLLTGFSSVQANLPALVQNTGWEIEVTAMIIRKKNISWTSSFNLTLPKNKLVDYPNLSGSQYINQYRLGQSLNIALSYHYTGVDPQTGVYTFQDIDKNGSISFPNDLLALKETGPIWYGGFHNQVCYKSLQLTLFFQFVKQNARNYLYSVGFTMPGLPQNQPVWILNHWQKPGDLAMVQSFSEKLGPAFRAYTLSRFNGDNTISDASFIRLKNVAITYSLPSRLLQKIHLRDLQVYVQGQNLLTLTHYLGLDPETHSVQVLPPLRMIVTGIRMNL
ncbi:MAG: SusC/RagA family TonB-linked outer membrane protein, partial [Flavisolibacter sp.]